MPFPWQSDKFSPKKAPKRKSLSLSNLSDMDINQKAASFGVDRGLVNVKLDKEELTFKQGEWVIDIPGDNFATSKEVGKLKNKINNLHEENNLLKLKLEIMVDMLTEHSAEVNILEKALEKYEKAY